MRRRRRSRHAAAPPPVVPNANSFIRPGVLIFAVALTVRVIHIVQLQRAPFFSVLVGDGRAYDDWALRLAAGDWIGQEVFYQAPLYPYFLGGIYAVFGHSLLAVRLCQAVAGAMACVCLGLAARNLFSRSAGAAAGLILALYAPAIFFDGLIQKSVLDVLFVCIALWMVSGLTLDPTRRTRWLWLGMTMGAMMLTRENALLWVPVLLAWVLLWVNRPAVLRERLTTAVVLLGGLGLVLLPVVARNSILGGDLYITTAQFGPNFYIGNNPGADGTYAPLRIGRGDPEFERQDATELAETAAQRRLTPAEVSSYWTNQALEYITSEPVSWIRLMGRKFVLIWNAAEVVDSESQDMHAEWSVPLSLLGRVGHFGVLVPLAVLGMVVSWPRRASLWIVYGLLLTYAVSVVIFYVFARYRFPLVPFLSLFASAGLVGIRRLRRERSFVWTTRLTVGVGVVAVFVNWPVLDAAAMNATSENYLGYALQADGRLDEAMAHYQRAVAFQPDHAEAYNNIGTVLRAMGRPAEAVGYYERALGFEPNLTQAHVNWGNALIDLERYADAIPHFRMVLRSEGEAVSIMNSLAVALAGSGDAAAAVETLRAAVAIDPNSVETQRNLGGALAESGAVEEGIDHLRRAADLDPTDLSIRRRLGMLLLNERRFDEAIGHLSSVRDETPGSAAAHLDLGVALGGAGRFEEAIEELREALALEPDNDIAQGLLEAALRATGG